MKILEHLAETVIARRRWVLGLVLAITAVTGYGATKVRLNADFATYLNQKNPLVRAYNYIGETFGGNSVGLVLVTAPDVFQPDVLRAIDRLTDAYRDVEGIAYVTSLTNVVDFRSVDGGIEVGRLVGGRELPRTPEEVAELRGRVMQTDRLVGDLVSADATAAAIMLRFAGGGSVGSERFDTALRVREATDAALGRDPLPEGTAVYFGGMPFLVYNMTLLVSGNMRVLAPLMGGVLLLILFLGIRAWGGVVYPLTVVVVSTLWTVGAMGFLGLKMDLLTGIMPVILLALGCADGIHFMKRFYEHRAEGAAPPDAARATYREMGVPLVVTTLTTMVGFASLSISDFAVIRQFGLLTAFGLLLALVVTLTLLPALASYGAGRVRGTRKGDNDPVSRRLARVVHRRPGAILLGSGALVALGLAGIPRVVKDVDWTLCLARGSDPFHAEMLIRDKFGGSLPLQVRVEGDLKDPAVLSVMRAVERRLDALPLADNAGSMASIVAEMNDVMNGRFTVPADAAGVSNLWFLVEDEEMMDQLVARENTQALIQARLANWHTESVAQAVDSVAAFLDALPARWAVLDPEALTAEQRDVLVAARRSEFARKLRWDLEGRSATAGIDRLESAVSALLEWTPADDTYARMRAAIASYAAGPEASVAMTEGQAQRLAEGVVDGWGEGEAPSMDVLTGVVKSLAPGADDWETEDLASSVDLIARDVVGAAQVDFGLARVEALAPAVQRDPTLRRKVRGTLWEAREGVWVVDADRAQRLGISGGPAVLRTVAPRFTRSGMASVLEEMERELTPTQVESVLITLAVVTVLLSLIFRSTVAGALALAPLVVTILVNFGVMGFFGVGLDSFTAMVASIAIGLGVDYAIHFTHRLKKELTGHDGDTEEALRRTLSTSGVAVMVNAASVGLGFLVLLAAGGQHIRRFGGLSSLTMLLAGALTLTLLPVLLVRIGPRLAGRRTTVAVARGVALTLAMAISPGALRAQEAGTLLARVDSTLNAPRDQTGLERTTLVDADGSTKERLLRFYQKGPEKRLVRFTEPADVRGVGFLRLAEDQMYLYLPAFRRVRRIASSIRNESFMGTDFSYEDLAQTRYSEDYDARAVSEEAGSYTLTLIPRGGADVSYGRLVMEVSSADWIPRKIDYFDADGERVKTLTVSEVRVVDGYVHATRMEMVTWRTGHRTVLELEEVGFDTGLPDDLFSQRFLKRPS